MSQFKQVSKVDLNLGSNKYQLKKYKSEKTDFSVVVTKTVDNSVECSIFIVTEPENDEGYVHSLEHLIYNGSKKYPYKGVLQKLNGDVTEWTDTGYTIFNFSAKGQDHALAVLPVLLDHVMCPLLSDEDYNLDVHHINGEGKDGGLLYEEMGGSCHPYKKVLKKLLKEVYPNSTYSHDYCGTDLAIRTSSTNSKIKEFHKKFYRPENITIIITGNVNDIDVLNVVTEFEDELIATTGAVAEKWIKPFQAVPPSPYYGEYNTYYSIQDLDGEDDENNGFMIFGWRGPVLSNAGALKDLTACEILLDYLTEKRGPLYKHLVDKKKKNIIVSSNINTEKVSLLRLELFNIPLEDMKQTKCRTLEYLKNIRDDIISLNMDKIKSDVMENLQIDEEITGKKVHADISSKLYPVSIYLDTDEFAASMNPQWHVKELYDESVDYWLALFRKYFTDNMVIANGIPTTLKDEEEEKIRVEKNREVLGEKGLAEKAIILQKALDFRKRPQPSIKDLLPVNLINVLDRLKNIKDSTDSQNNATNPASSST